MSANNAYAETLPPLEAGKTPQNFDEMWAGFDPRREPLETEVLKEWEQDGVVCRVVRFHVGEFKGAPAKVAAFYAFPKGAQKVPGLLQLHGGGQSASFDSVFANAKNGYAALSLNWGGNKMSFGRTGQTYDGPQTDWGKLDATHPPQRSKNNHFAGSLAPDEYTLDSVTSPRNSNWFLVLIAARRALTFLEQQSEVDGARLGVYGHSMGGKLTTNLAGIDRRVRAAVPSCGGSGDGPDSKAAPLELACVSDNAYIPRITCPTLWLSPTNDFHANIYNMAKNWRDLPDARLRFSIAPHFNHRHTNEHALTQHLWFEEHLKGAFKMPQTPKITLHLNTPDGVPQVVVTPDTSLPVQRVDVYYSIDPHNLTAFWRDAGAAKQGELWTARCRLMSLEQPLYAYADVIYETPEAYRNIANPPGQGNSPVFVLSSRVQVVTSTQLQAAGVKATDQAERLIDNGARGWHDWYLLNWAHPPLWTATTRKLKDPKWRGPDGARLVFEVKTTTDNTLVVTVNTNAWGAFSNKPAVDYVVAKPLKASPEWQSVSVSLDELAANDPKITAPLSNWRTVTEFSLCPSGEVVKDGQKVKVGGKAWDGPREIRNLRWEGGEYAAVQAATGTLSAAEREKAFNEAIKKSLEQEKGDAKPKS